MIEESKPYFATPLIAKNLAGKKWELVSNLVYITYEIDGLPYQIVVPTGYVTDNYSIPNILFFVPKLDDEPEPAVVHDWLYDNWGKVPFMDKPLTKKKCDEIFHEAMRVQGINWFRRQYFYRAVRLNLKKSRKWPKSAND